MDDLWKRLGSWQQQGIGSGLQRPPAPLLHLGRPLHQPAEEGRQLLLDLGLGPQTATGSHFLPRPIPSGQFHYFHLPSLQADRRVVAGLLTPPGTGRVHQGWLASLDQLARQVGIGSAMGLILKEELGPPGLRR